MVTCGRGPRPVERTISRHAYGLGRVEPPRDERDAQVLVSSGIPHEDVRIALVDPETGTPCAPGQVGEIWIAGKSVSRGYWNRPEENERVFAAQIGKEGPFLRTGDLGFVEAGELFVSGRIKDVVIIRGRKLHPNDIEAELEVGIDGLRASSTCAFGVTLGDEERVVIIASVGPVAIDKDHLIEAIRRRLADRFELSPSAILLVRPRDLPRTSSGKVQRAACKRAFLDGAFREVARWSTAPAPEAWA